MPQRGRVSTILDGIAAVAVTTASVALIWSVLYSQGIRRPDAPSDLVATIDVPDGIDILNTAPTRGEEGARIALLEFSDYQCPFCARHATDTFKQLDQAYVTSGKLRYIFANFPLENLHPYAVKAGQAAECARDEGKFWEMHERLFANQKMLSDTEVMKYADDLNLTRDKFAACLKSAASEQRIRTDQALAAQLGVTSTPTFILGEIRNRKFYPKRKIAGAVPYPIFQKEIDAILTK